MTTSNLQNQALPTPITVPTHETEEHTYPMSRQGRRQAILLLLGVASIWIFALWSLITILQDGVNGVEWVSLLLMLGMLLVAPAVAWTLLEEANARITTTSKGIEYRTIAGITLTYNWEELEGFKSKQGRSRLASFFLGDDNEQATKAVAQEPQHGGNNTTEEQIGQVVAAVEHTELAQPVTQGADIPDSATSTENEAEDQDEDEPETLILNVRHDSTNQIANPLVRFLHKQAHGPSLPIYGSLENRAQLLSEIAAKLVIQ